MSQVKQNNAIREAREALGLTQTEVAKKAKVHVNYYARIERGEATPSIEVLQTIIKILKLKSSDVLSF